MATANPAGRGGGGAGRMYWLDNMRSVMTTIVIATHTGAAYAFGGGNVPHPAGFKKSSPVLIPAVAFSYSYGLGQFFWLSGLMSAMALSRTSGSDFLKSKIMRLGLPSLVYSIFLNPLQAIALRPRQEGNLSSIIRDYWKAVLDFKGWKTPGAGVAWYTMTLFIFDLGALLLKRCLDLFSSGKARSAEFTQMAKLYGLLSRWGWLLVAATRWLISTKFPVGWEFRSVNVQPWHLPHHFSGYLLGFMAYHLKKPRMSSLYDGKSGPATKLSFRNAIAIAVATMPLILLPSWLRARKAAKESEKAGEKERAATVKAAGTLQLSGWTADAALFALWNEFSFHTVAPAFMSHWERAYNRPQKKGLWSPRNAFAAYLLHSPISWFMGQGLHNLMCWGEERPAWMDTETWQNVGPIIMTAGASYLETAASYAAGMLLIANVPGAGDIL